MGLLDGKVALVTGAARGQGRAHAVTLAREGADVIALDLDRQIDTVPYETARAADLERTVTEVEELDRRIVARTVDVRSSDGLAAVVAEGLDAFGRIDVLVANAGIYSQAPFWEMDEQTWDDVMDVNLKGTWRTVKAVAPHMISRRTGSVVLTSSVNGMEGNPGAAHYAASLHFGILGGQGALPPETIANAAAWIASDGAFAVTGQAVVVDAGHTILPGFNPAPVRP